MSHNICAVQFVICNDRALFSLFLFLHFYFSLGQGVFTTREFKPDEFLLEYAGELLSYKEASRRESSYTEVDGSFLFFFNAQNKVLW